MATYVLRRLIQAIPILIGISVVSFFIIYSAPGDPTDRFRSDRVSPETIENLIRLYGLDKPLPEQFVKLVHHLLEVLEPDGVGLLLRRRPAGP